MSKTGTASVTIVTHKEARLFALEDVSKIRVAGMAQT